VVVEIPGLFNPNMIKPIVFVPGVVANLVMLVGMMLTALAVVREKRAGPPWSRSWSLPSKPFEFLLGKRFPLSSSPWETSSW